MVNGARLKSNFDLIQPTVVHRLTENQYAISYQSYGTIVVATTVVFSIQNRHFQAILVWSTKKIRFSSRLAVLTLARIVTFSMFLFK